MVDSSADSALHLFTAPSAGAAAGGAELRLLATLQGTPATVTGRRVSPMTDWLLVA